MGQNKEFNDTDLLDLISGIAKMFEIYSIIIHPNFKPFSTVINITPAEYKFVINKKRKETEREMEKIRNEHRSLLEDVKKVNELREMNLEYLKIENSIEYMENFLFMQTKNICKIMSEQEFINNLGDGIYELTALGNIAANIAEIHPLPFTKIMMNNAYFGDFTPKLLIGLFSCFTDVKIPYDQRISIPTIDNQPLKRSINEIIEQYKLYESMEHGLDLRTGINYENALIFDKYSVSNSKVKMPIPINLNKNGSPKTPNSTS
jgi:hypothetical protein